MPDWRVLVAGRIAGHYRQRTGAAEAVLIGGHIDNHLLDVVYSAADLVVVSFVADFHRDSGVLTDAISLGVPVVCSDGGPTADVVRRYSLGVVFAPGNPDSLERAVRIAPTTIEPSDLERARSDLSNRAIALGLLRALEYTPRSAPGPGGQR